MSRGPGIEKVHNVISFWGQPWCGHQEVIVLDIVSKGIFKRIQENSAHELGEEKTAGQADYPYFKRC